LLVRVVDIYAEDRVLFKVCWRHQVIVVTDPSTVVAIPVYDPTGDMTRIVVRLDTSASLLIRSGVDDLPLPAER